MASWSPTLSLNGFFKSMCLSYSIIITIYIMIKFVADGSIIADLTRALHLRLRIKTILKSITASTRHVACNNKSGY